MKGRTTRGRGLSVAAAVTTLTLGAMASGCSGDSSEASSDEMRDQLATAKTQLDEAPSVKFSLATDELPDGVTGLLEAEGVGTHEPAFEGSVSVSAMGGVSADVIAVGDDV